MVWKSPSSPPEDQQWIVCCEHLGSRDERFDAGVYAADTDELVIDLGEVESRQPLSDYDLWAALSVDNA